MAKKSKKAAKKAPKFDYGKGAKKTKGGATEKMVPDSAARKRLANQEM